MHKILILEDDLYLSTTLKEELEEEGFIVSTTDNSNTVLDFTFENKFDIYLFDVSVIGMDGFTLLRCLRDAGDETPTIFLTSKNKSSDVIEGFDMGANDYVKKPFDMSELLVRIKRFLKNQKKYTISPNIEYIPNIYEVINHNEKFILKQKEGQILEFFLTHTEQIITKEQILDEFYNGEYITDSTFRGYINRIKDAIGKKFLRNVRGQGYIFETI